MIREMQEADLADVMEIWFNENINSHDFIEEEYWKNKHSRMQDSVVSSLPRLTRISLNHTPYRVRVREYQSNNGN